MAATVSKTPAMAHMNGHIAPSPAEDEELYAQLLQLQDAVITGKHPQFKLPPAAIEQLKAALIAPESGANSTAYATNNALPTVAAKGLPGLYSSSSGLDPIFLEKSDSLVRAEGQLKRQRIERDLQTQSEQRKHLRFSGGAVGDPNAEGPSRIGIDHVLNAAMQRIPPLSGLKSERNVAESMSSFDTNDYYSSRAPSPWSSDGGSPSKGSDKGAGAFTGDFERLDGAAQPFAQSSASAWKRGVPDRQPAPVVYTGEDEDAYEPEDDDDDEYTPPDATAFDPAPANGTAMAMQQTTPPEDDNSDYEPGEITQDSTAPTPYQPCQPQTAQPSPHVPIIRNHLTHIAAPQPNRVSPLATAKAPSYELELVNGKPEVVQRAKPQHRSHPVQSQVSTASPSGTGAGGSNKKKRNKKRKREQEPNNRSKKRRERQAAAQSPPSPAYREPYIKDEPVSPPPFASMHDVPAYGQPQYRPAPAHVDLSSPAQPPRPQYVTQQPQSGLRHEYAQPTSPAVVRVASPAAYRPVQRDTQDLRRVASLHYAQRPPSPGQRAYSPVGPYRAASMGYGGHQPPPEAPEPPRYAPQPEPQAQYVRAERAPTAQYQAPYERAQSPAAMPPPPPRQVMVDQYGNKYYLAEAAPASTRASVAPPELRPEPQPMYERAPSRMFVAYQPQQPRYEQVNASMPPPAPPQRQEQQVQYVDANGYRMREYSTRPAEPARYAEQPTSPAYQQMPRYEPAPPAASERTSPVYREVPRYETMPPPRPPAAAERTSPVYREVPRYETMAPPPLPTAARAEQTSPVYQPVPRAYSVRPEEPTASYVRQASVAPVSYGQRDMAPPPAPARAMSVAPGGAYAGAQQPMYGYAPAPQQLQGVKYVDQYGREVLPHSVRQVSVARY